MNLDFINSEKLLQILKVGIYILLLIPIFILPNVIFPYVFSKVIFFQIIVEILFAVYLLLIIVEPKYRPKLNWLNILMAVFLMILIITTLTSVDCNHSFWGGVEWHNSLFLYLHLIGFFLILQVFQSKKQWQSFIKFSLIIGLIVSLSAICQRLGLFYQPVSRVSGLLGNATFLAAYLIWQLFFSIWSFIKNNNLHWKIFCAFNFLIGLSAFILSQSRGAILGLLVGFVASFFLFVLLFAPRKYKKYLILTVIILVIVSSLVLISLYQKYQSDWTRSRNIQTRLFCWKITWQAWQDKFWLGWGLENFYIAFNQYFDPGYLTWTTEGSMHYEAALNFAHNKILDTGLTLGIFGLLNYLCILIAAIVLILKQKKLEAIVLAGLLIAYFVNNLFLFDFILSFFWFFFILAYISVIYGNKIIQVKFNLNNTVLFGMWLIFCAFSLWLVNFGNIKPVKASYYAHQAWKMQTKQNYSLMIKNYQKAYDYHTYIDEKICEDIEPVASQIIKSNLQNQKAQEFYLYVLDLMQKRVENHPMWLSGYLQLGELYNAGYELDPTRLDLAKATFLQAVQLAPSRPEPYIHLGQTMIYKNDQQRALQYFNQAIDLNKDFYVGYLILGRAYQYWQMTDLAVEQFEKAHDLGYRGTKEMQTIAQFHNENHNYLTALFYYQELHKIQPNSEEYLKKIEELQSLTDN